MRLVIRDPEGVADHVELFLSTRMADTDRIGANVPRSGEPRAKHAGAAFFLDGPMDGITPLTRLDMTSDQVVWELRAEGPGDTKVKLLVAVAFDANNAAVAIAKMTDVTIPAHDTVATVLELEPALQLPPSEARMPGGIRVWAWRKHDAAAAACLAIEESTAATIKRWWLVPPDDPDCDDVQLECDKYLYQADYSSQAEVCIVPAMPNLPNPMPCRVGSKVCQDEVSAGECTPHTNPQYCLANAFCEPSDCFQNTSECEQLDSSRVHCDLALQQDGSTCPEMTMGFGPLLVNPTLAGGLFPGACEAVAFASQDMTAGIVSSPTIDVNGATFGIEGFAPASCTFKIEITGGQYDASTASSGEPIVLPIDITRGSSHLVVPVFVKISPGACDDRPPTCDATRASVSELSNCQ